MWRPTFGPIPEVKKIPYPDGMLIGDGEKIQSIVAQVDV
jgi:hypothetical protein